MSITDVIEMHEVQWDNEGGLYRCKITVNQLFKVSIIAGVGAYSNPRTMLSDFSHYELYEVAFFDMNDNWLEVIPVDGDYSKVTYSRNEFTDVWSSVAPFEIKDAINALLEAWEG